MHCGHGNLRDVGKMKECVTGCYGEVTLRKEKTVEEISSLCSARDWETERTGERERDGEK